VGKTAAGYELPRKFPADGQNSQCEDSTVGRREKRESWREGSVQFIRRCRFGCANCKHPDLILEPRRNLLNVWARIWAYGFSLPRDLSRGLRSVAWTGGRDRQCFGSEPNNLTDVWKDIAPRRCGALGFRHRGPEEPESPRLEGRLVRIGGIDKNGAEIKIAAGPWPPHRVAGGR